ncbi:MAG TPA: hypothetical protein VEI83_02645 [Acidimicrobiales bacterium]|nr:hypothetical protein [Acidimicrobiales bacterium]
MGLMDKMKEQAASLAEKGKAGVAQGQAKLDTMQAKKQLDALLHDLGAATYAAERKGASRDEVERLLAAIDAHESENGPVDTTTSAAAATATSTTSSTEGGDFRLDDE